MRVHDARPDISGARGARAPCPVRAGWVRSLAGRLGRREPDAGRGDVGDAGDESRLPEEFADLEPFAPRWSLATEPERWARRHESTLQEMRALYEAVFPRVPAIHAHLDRFGLDELGAAERNLLRLLLSFVMVSFPVEVWDGVGIPDAGHAELPRVTEPTY